MHTWGDKNVDWKGIDDAAYYIAHWLKTWVRMPIQQYKEKFGTVRVYGSFGWHGIYSIYRPGYCWYPKWWPMRLDFWIADTLVFGFVNKVGIAIQKKAYAWRYKKAVEKWPHLREEIVSSADYGELFEGVIYGYKHSDYWTSV